jgi:hypothetical protein
MWTITGQLTIKDSSTSPLHNAYSDCSTLVSNSTTQTKLGDVRIPADREQRIVRRPCTPANRRIHTETTY